MPILKNKASLVLTFAFGFMLVYLSGCGSGRETTGNHSFQNFSVRYNILFNARKILTQVQRSELIDYQDDYSQLLPIFIRPELHIDDDTAHLLDSVVGKANRIIFEKKKSDYVDDAYVMLAEASYLKGDLYSASEYYQYVYKQFPSMKNQGLNALVARTICLIQSGFTSEAASTIDTILKYREAKTGITARLEAAQAALSLLEQKKVAAKQYLREAIARSTEKGDRLRWIYILAQLEANENKKESHRLFSVIAKDESNQELHLNALLALAADAPEGTEGGDPGMTVLTKLLSKERYLSFRPVLYYHQGLIYLKNKDEEQANKSFRLSTSLKDDRYIVTAAQSYNQLAELAFNRRDYALSKSYYDSALVYLPQTHPLYSNYKQRSEHIKPLSEYYKIIAREDAFQHGRSYVEIPETIPVRRPAAETDQSSSSAAFYFNNPRAVAQGRSEFERVWGKRGNSDNWRGNQYDTPSIKEDDREIKNFSNISELPNPAAMLVSKERMARAYYELAMFYKDQLNNHGEAIRNLDTLITRLPQSSYTASGYYQLYTLLLPFNTTLAGRYRDSLSRRFPDSKYAQAMLGVLPAKETEADYEHYTKAFNLYKDGQYHELIALTSKVSSLNPAPRLAAQYSYLGILATGYLSGLAPFEKSLQDHLLRYPADSLVTPLVNQHLVYIQQHRVELEQRSPVLIRDTRDPFTDIGLQKKAAINEGIPDKSIIIANTIETSVRDSAISKVVAQGPREKKERRDPKLQISAPDTLAEKSAREDRPQLPEEGTYYFVINVNSAQLDLSPSRFGIGQFNRAHYAAGKVIHQLRLVNDENALIYTGPFSTLSDVTAYKMKISPLLAEIMKIAKERYDTFVISREALEKLNSRTSIEAYREYYKELK